MWNDEDENCLCVCTRHDGIIKMYKIKFLILFVIYDSLANIRNDWAKNSKHDDVTNLKNFLFNLCAQFFFYCLSTIEYNCFVFHSHDKKELAIKTCILELIFRYNAIMSETDNLSCASYKRTEQKHDEKN